MSQNYRLDKAGYINRDKKISFKYVELQEAEKIYKEYLINISKIIKNIKEIN